MRLLVRRVEGCRGGLWLHRRYLRKVHGKSPWRSCMYRNVETPNPRFQQRSSLAPRSSPYRSFLCLRPVAIFSTFLIMIIAPTSERTSDCVEASTIILCTRLYLSISTLLCPLHLCLPSVSYSSMCSTVVDRLGAVCVACSSGRTCWLGRMVPTGCHLYLSLQRFGTLLSTIRWALECSGSHPTGFHPMERSEVDGNRALIR